LPGKGKTTANNKRAIQKGKKANEISEWLEMRKLNKNR